MPETFKANAKTGEGLPSPGAALVGSLKQLWKQITATGDPLGEAKASPTRLREMAEEAFWQGAGGSAGLTRIEATIRPLQNWLKKRRTLEATRGIHTSDSLGMLSYTTGALASRLPKKLLDPLEDIRILPSSVLGDAAGSLQPLGKVLPTKSILQVGEEAADLRDLWATLVHEGVHAAQYFPQTAAEKKLFLPYIREAERLRVLNRKYHGLDDVAYHAVPTEAHAYRLEQTIKGPKFPSKDFYSSFLEEVDNYEKSIRPRYKIFLDEHLGQWEAALSK